MTTQREHPDKYFHRTWQAFYANLGALRLFSAQVAKISDQLDRDRIRDAAHELADILDDDPQDVEDDLLRYLPSLDETDVYPNFLEAPDVRKALAGLRDNAFKDRLQNWAIQNPRKWHKLAAVLQEYFAQPPANGVLLRRSALIILVGFLDVLFERLFLGYFYFQQPGKPSRKTAHEQQARKKAQKVNRSPKGWLGRITNFQEFGVDIAPLSPYMDEFAEIAQRRNLLVHKDGVVDEIYLKYTSPLHQPSDAQLGRMLLVPTRYLQRAFQVVTVAGFWLAQAAWRQWNPRKQLERAHRSADQVVYDALYRKEYRMTAELASLALRFRFPKKHAHFKHAILVNQAIAFGKMGDQEKKNTVIKRLAQTKHDLIIEIALAILRQDIPRSQQLLLQAKRENLLHTISPHWPLFEPLEQDTWFQSLFVTPDMGELPLRHR